MNKSQQRFVETVWNFYGDSGRHDLPWRKTHDPYRILVSEVMLQQTGTRRVEPRYRTFLERFPSVRALAAAPLGAVLREWQGLGYNRRAKMLHGAAKEISGPLRGRFPRTYDDLRTLPGVGAYTAGAVMAFAFNVPVPFIETNIRTVYLSHFFKDATDVDDTELLPHIIETMDLKRPREWYYALMDYGAYLKKATGNPNSRSRHYARQSAFKGSDREIRGAIVRALATRPYTRPALLKYLPFEPYRIDAALERLFEEGLIEKKGRSLSLPS